MQKGFVPILFIVIVALALGVGGYLVYASRFSNPSSPPNPSPVACTQDAKLCPDGSSVGRVGQNCEFAPCPTEATSSADTANWKTYTNNESSYSFKYPQTWQLEQEGTTIRIFDPKGRHSPSFSDISYSVFSSDTTSIEDYVGQLIKSFPWLQFTYITIGGLEGKRTTGIPSAALNDHVFVKRGNTIYEIQLSNEGASITKDTFDQILSTFRFIK